jgi:hypothetical protein
MTAGKNFEQDCGLHFVNTVGGNLIQNIEKLTRIKAKFKAEGTFPLFFKPTCIAVWQWGSTVLRLKKSSCAKIYSVFARKTKRPPTAFEENLLRG